MPKSVVSKILQGVIWAGFAVILLSPLYVSSQLFFPFITTKTFAFMIATEVIFVAYLLLCLIDSKFRLRFNLVMVLMLVYLGILTLASAMGNDFYRSFWSNNERSDGILLLIHLFLFVTVLTGFLRTAKKWLYLFDIFLVAVFCVSLVALDQYLALAFPSWGTHFLSSSNGARLAATIGNAGYVGGYMVFGVFISLFMLFKRENRWLKLAYGVMTALTLFIAIQTQTRGAWLALGLLGGIFILYLAFFYFSDLKGKLLNGRNIRIAAIVVIALGLAGVGFVFANKQSDFVKSSPLLNRVASISVSDGNNRLVTWGIAWQGIKEKPILGYGQENFYQVFDRNYSTKNTEQWFDRAHNMVFDRTITGGFLGLVSYLALLLVPFYFLWKFYKNSDNDTEAERLDSDSKPKNWGKKYFTPMIFTMLILAYIIQNMFIFEALATYIPLMMVIAFAGMYGKHYDWKLLENRKFKAVIFIIFAVALIPALYFFNIKPLNANKDFIRVLADQRMGLSQKITAYDDVLARNTAGNQEYRKYLGDYFVGALSQWLGDPEAQKQIVPETMAGLAGTVQRQADLQVNQNPHSVSNYLMAANVYMAVSAFGAPNIEKAIELSDRAIALSPSRPQVHYQAANARLYAASYYKYANQDDEMVKAYAKAGDLVYQGASLNYDKGIAANDFLGMMTNLSRNGDFVSAVKSVGLGGKTMSQVFDEVRGWISQSDAADEQKAAMEAQVDSLAGVFKK